MSEKRNLDLTTEQMEDLIGAMMWFWGNLHQRWRLAAEKEYGLEGAVKIEMNFIGDVGKSQGRRYKQIFKIGGGIAGLMEAFKYMPENFVEPFEVLELSEKRLIVQNPSCSVQKARTSRGKKVYPCKDIAIVYFTQFAREIDPKIRMTCLGCTPDESEGFFCKWQFEMTEGD